MNKKSQSRFSFDITPPITTFFWFIVIGLVLNYIVWPFMAPSIQIALDSDPGILASIFLYSLRVIIWVGYGILFIISMQQAIISQSSGGMDFE